MSSKAQFAMRNFGSVESQSLGKPAARYPAALATDSDLIIAVDRQQTTLAQPLDSVSTSMTVTSAAGIVAYNLLSIDNEIVKVTGAPVSNVVPIQRAFDGTTAAIHLASAPVYGFVDAWHHNALVAEIEAIEQTLGTNLSSVTTVGLPFYLSTTHNFPPQTPGGSLTVGTNSITLTPVPLGVNGTDGSHYLYISGGTGAAEAALITGGTAVSGAASGTVFVTCANAHSGAWTIQSATGGIQEAVCHLPAQGGEVLVNASVSLYAAVSTCGTSGDVTVTKLSGITITHNNNPILGAYPNTGSRQSYKSRVAWSLPANAAPYTGMVLQHGTPQFPITGNTTSPGTKALAIECQIDSTAQPNLTENNALEVYLASIQGSTAQHLGMRCEVDLQGTTPMTSFAGGTAVSGFVFTAVGGFVYGMNPYVRCTGIPNQANLVGMEIDTDVQVAALGKVGLQIVDVSTSTASVANADLNIGLYIVGQSGCAGYMYGLRMAPRPGLAFPIAAAGTGISITGGTVTRGIDLNGLTCSKSAIRATLTTYASNAAATAAGLTPGDFYTDGAGNVKVVF